MTSSPLTVIFKAKHRMVDNYIQAMKNHIWIHAIMALLVVIILVGGGSGFFYVLFDFLLSENLQPFGGDLLNYLIGMIFLTFFSCSFFRILL